MNFKRYIEASDTWVDSHYIMGTSTDTITTLPAVLYPNDTTATVGLKGQMEQSSTPSPTSPVMPQGTGERTGNLAYGRIEKANVGSNGTIVRTTGYNVAIARVEVGKVYTANSYVLAFYTDEPTIGSVSYNSSRIIAIAGRPTTVTAPITGYVAFRLNIGEQAMLNTGSTPLPYEPYGYKIPILSANTTTPVYLGEVETTRKIKKLVLTGEESWSKDSDTEQSARYYTTVSDIESGTTNLLSSHFTQSAWYEIGTMRGYRKTIIFSVDKTICATVADFKSWLAAQYAAGTPVTIWYVLATEETGIVNEPIRKIGDYADEVSGITIPTIAGANTLSVDTAVHPSELTVNYKGWHPVSAVHERENGRWD